MFICLGLALIFFFREGFALYAISGSDGNINFVIKFSGRQALKRKTKPKQTDKLVFVIQYTDDIQRMKQIFNKHWKLIKYYQYLNF